MRFRSCLSVLACLSIVAIADAGEGSMGADELCKFPACKEDRNYRLFQSECRVHVARVKFLRHQETRLQKFYVIVKRQKSDLEKARSAPQAQTMSLADLERAMSGATYLYDQSIQQLQILADNSFRSAARLDSVVSVELEKVGECRKSLDKAHGYVDRQASEMTGRLSKLRKQIQIEFPELQ